MTDDRVDVCVSRVVREFPNAVAVVADDAQLTYGELGAAALAIEDRLRSAGVQAEEPVVLLLPRSAAFIVSALGVLRAGACYVALDSSMPPERVAFMIRDCGARVVLTSADAPVDLQVDAQLLEVTGHGPVGGLEPLPGPSPALSGGDDPSPLAYIIYTSGSTGVPKGVMIEHAGLLNLVRWHQRAFAVTAEDRGTLIASTGFDACVWELWPYLTAGAAVHVPSAEVRADPSAMRDWLVEQQITVTFLPTVLAEEVLSQPWPDHCALRALLTGGDVLHRRPRPELTFEVVNNYGVTEGTVVSTSGAVEPSDSGGVGPSIGRAIDGVEVRVIAPDGSEVAPGEPGELLVGGVSVARGYVGRAELTGERFLSPDALPNSQHRWYRTGDLVRRREDGSLEFLGRLDDQLQVRGFRIEPAEVVRALDRHPAVRASSVISVEGPDGLPRLHAFVVASDPSGSAAREELQQHLATTLPDYMVPSGFDWLDGLPQTPNGKLDQSALLDILVARQDGESPAPEPLADNDGTPLEEEFSAVEHEVSSLIAGLLGVPTIGPVDNFFMLGGHSMLGAQLIASLGNRFGVDIGLRALFDNPTAAGLAAEVQRLIEIEIETLDDDEAAALLAEITAATPDPAAGR